MPAESPIKLNRPWPQAKSAKSPFESLGGSGFLDQGGVAASGILTMVGEPAADDVVLIDSKTYTFKGVAATEVLTFAANASDLETVTIDGKVYTFDDTSLDDIDGHVLIGATASASIDNLIAAITLGAGAGTLYATSTTLHPTVTAAAGSGDTMDATAKAKGTAGNSIVVLEGINGSWGSTPMSGGLSLTNTNGFVFIGDLGADGALANLVAAIELGAGSGTAYAAAMTLHPTVSAAEGAGITMDALAKNQGVAGNSIVTTTDVSGASWAPVATMAGGVDPGDVASFVPIVQWSSIRIRMRITGSGGSIGLEFARPARQKKPNTSGLAFVYTVDQPSVDGTSWVDGTELSLEITAAEHQGENWMKVTLSPTDDGAVLDFFDISGVNIGQGS